MPQVTSFILWVLRMVTSGRWSEATYALQSPRVYRIEVDELRTVPPNSANGLGDQAIVEVFTRLYDQDGQLGFQWVASRLLERKFAAYLERFGFRDVGFDWPQRMQFRITFKGAYANLKETSETEMQSLIREALDLYNATLPR